jgi:hypothetical protein
MQSCSFMEARYTGVRAVYWGECGKLSWTAVETGASATDWDERDTGTSARDWDECDRLGRRPAKLAVIQ